ncbi:oxaloacetate carrier [Trametes cingulata]|nr:oxaloacetate carrier [Trametes cingulata]
MANLSTFEGFVCGGLAGCIAVRALQSSAEMAKTRMQLQGELMKGGGARVYKNVFDVLVKTIKNEGIRGVQRGLGPAYFYQVLLNGSRLGLYEPLRRWLNTLSGNAPTQPNSLTSAAAGSLSAIVGSTLGNPLFLVKTRMQAYSPVLPVGAQRYYRQGWEALLTIVREEGFKGLLRGCDAAVLRGAIGGSASFRRLSSRRTCPLTRLLRHTQVQIPSYVWTKNQLVSRGIARPDSLWTYLASSSVSGVILCLVMQPADTASCREPCATICSLTSHRCQTLTRMYNQPTVRGSDGRTVGTLYRNPLDCLWKTLRAEGIYGWYKGSTAHFLRIAPHTIITLTANDIIVRLYLDARRREH